MLNPIRYLNSCFEKIPDASFQELEAVPFVGPLATMWKTHLLYKEIKRWDGSSGSDVSLENERRCKKAVQSFVDVHGPFLFTAAFRVAIFAFIFFASPVVAIGGGAFSIASVVQFLYVLRRIPVVTNGGVTLGHDFSGSYTHTSP